MNSITNKLERFELFKLFNLFILICILFGCAKKPIQIGREHPEEEIKKCIALSDKKDFKDAIECLEIFKSRFPKSPWGIEAELKIGDNYFRQKEYLLAADSYQSFIKLNPTHPKLDYAYYRSGLSYLNQSPKAIDRDQEYLENAIASFEIVIRNFPDSAYLNITRASLSDARSKIARRHFYVGRFYFRTGEYIASIPRFKEVADRYKDTGLAGESLYYLTLANLELGRFDDAKSAFSTLSTDYPRSKYVDKLEKKMLRAAHKE